MAKVFVMFRGKGCWVTEIGASVALHFLAKEADALPNPPDWLIQLSEYWHMQVKIGAAVSPEFSRLQSQEQVDLVILLCQQALGRLDEFRDSISKELLNGIGIMSVTFTKDIPSERYKSVIKFFIQLLQGQITTEASNSEGVVDYPQASST